MDIRKAVQFDVYVNDHAKRGTFSVDRDERWPEGNSANISELY